MRRFVLLLVAFSACESSFRVLGDPTIPVTLDLASGVPMTRLQGSAQATAAIVDTGSPLSQLAPEAGCDVGTPLEVDGADAMAAPRLVFPDLHPLCLSSGGSVLAGDLFINYEVVLAGPACLLPLGCLQLIPGEVEPTDAFGSEGFAVAGFHLLGGGNYLDARGRAVSYSATRVPLRVCVNPPALYDPFSKDLGKDLTLLVATGIAPIVIGKSATLRAFDDDPQLGAPSTVVIPSTDGPVAASSIGAIQRLAIVGQTLTDQDPGPCAELQRARCLVSGAPPADCDRLVLTGDALDNESDREPYVLFEGPIDAFEIEDDTPYLLAATTEIRPKIAGADGFIGATLLRRLHDLRIDYRGVSGDSVDAGPRFIARCTGAGNCMTGSADCVACPRTRK